MDISNIHFMHSGKIYMKNIPVDDGYIFFKLNNPGNSSASSKKLFYFKIKNSVPETNDTYNKTLILSNKGEFIAHCHSEIFSKTFVSSVEFNSHSSLIIKEKSELVVKPYLCSHTFFYNRIDQDNIVIYIPDNYDAMSISTIQTEYSGKFINNLLNIVSTYSNLELEYSNIDYISSIKCFKEDIHYEDLRIEQLKIIDNEYYIQNLELVNENSSLNITINGQFTFVESNSNNISEEIIFPLQIKQNEYNHLSVKFNTELKVFPGTIIEDIEFIHSGIPSSCTVSVSKCTKDGFNFTIINGSDQNISIDTISWYLKSKIKSNIIVKKLTLGKNDIDVSKISKKNNSIEVMFDGLILSNLIDVIVDNSIKMELEYYKFLGFKTIAKWKTRKNILNKNVILFNIKDVYNNEFKNHNGVNKYFIN